MMDYDAVEKCTYDMTRGLLDDCHNRVVMLNAVKALVKEYSISYDSGDYEKCIHFSHLITDILSMFSTMGAVQEKLKLKVAVDKWHIIAQTVDDLLNYHTRFCD